MKKKISKMLSVTLSILMLFSLLNVTAYAAETKREKVTVSLEEYETFLPEEEKIIDGKKYRLISHTVISKNDSTFDIIIDNLPLMDYEPAVVAVNPNNSAQSGKLQDLKYKEDIINDRLETVSESVSYKAVPINYSIPRSYSKEYFDEETNSRITSDLKLKSSKKSSSYWTTIKSLKGYVTTYNGLFYNLEGSNVSIPKNDNAPEYKGYETAILKSINLNPDNYRIVGSSWAGDPYYNSSGELCRNCIYQAEMLVCDITAEYESEIHLPDMVSYTAIITYFNEADSTVELELVYEKMPINTAVVVISVASGILMISALVAAILIFLSRKRKSSEKNKEV